MVYNFLADEIFEIAIRIEENGHSFYIKASETVDMAEVKDIFSSLAIEEKKHRELFQELRDSLPSSAKESTLWDPDNETGEYLKLMAKLHVFSTSQGVEQAISTIRTPSEAIKMAITFEKDTLIFFLQMKEMTDAREGKEFVNRLINEEKRHLRNLAEKLASLS